MPRTATLVCILSVPQLFSLPALSAPAPGKIPGETVLVRQSANGSLAYAPYSAQGDIIPDFSHCGYKGGGVALPDAPVRETLSPSADARTDDTERIQAAIDSVSKLQLQKDGLRGAVLLKRGAYRCSDSLRLHTSGVVLRGEGDGENGTLIIATARKRIPLITISGGEAGPAAIKNTAQNITDAYVPVGANIITVADASKFAVGQTIFVIRHGNAGWIKTIGMDRITPRAANPAGTVQWAPFDLSFDRVIAAINGNRIVFDAPIVCAIDRRWGGGAIARYDDSKRIENCGVENLRADSVYNTGKTARHNVAGTYASDEDHATHLVRFGSVKNSWARNLTSLHFYHGLTSIGKDAKWITVQDCRSLEPVSIITGGRRYPFAMTGQLSLVQRCYSDKGRHAFAFGARVPGPNVFLNCRSERDYAASEPHHRWSTGGLYDNVEARIAIQDRQHMGSGHGWAGANYVVWNCKGALVCQQPPTAQNFAIGFIGEKLKPAFPRPDGWWESYGKPVVPASLYEAQLEDRKTR
ncbi:MAG: hypothetical protein LBM04_01570 [Opitutaceae bacterium]|nr:hypothetical protein [Opitutaceae bacterium]